MLKERKKKRRHLKENAEKHPKKYKGVLEEIRRQTAERVRKHRLRKRQNQQAEIADSPSVTNSQKKRRLKEKHRLEVAESRKKEHVQKEANRNRVRNFRLRVKLGSAFFNKDNAEPIDVTTPSHMTTDEKGTGYKHKSSRARAVKRVRDSLPETPAKKVQIIEKIFTGSSPRSKDVLSQSPSLQAVFLKKDTRKKLETEFSIADSVKSAVKTLPKKQRKIALNIVARNLVKKSISVSSAAKHLDIPRRTLARNVEINEERKARNDKISSEDSELIQNFYLEEASREMPNKRDILLIKNNNGEKVPVQKHIMEMTQNEAYSKFKEQNPAVRVGQRKFDSLKPTQVRQTKSSNRIVCCCTYCENIRLKIQALNQFTAGPFRSSASIIEATLCPKTGQFHNIMCLKRNCDNCGTKKLIGDYENELSEKGDTSIKWKEWKKCVVPLDAERNVSRVLLSNCETTFRNFFSDHLCACLEPHGEHVFRASWQSVQFCDNINNLKEGEIVMAMDFSENYTCRYGREIQPFHWCQKQVTIHPMMLYYNDTHGELQKDGFVCITDDLKHDSHAVAAFEKEAISHLRNKNVTVNTVHEWTDGCASQYKGCHSFAAISVGESSLQAKVVRNFFETSHGKGPCDGLGGIVKHKASRAVIQNTDLSISNGKDLHEFCQTNLENVGKSTFKSRISRYSANKRVFKYVENIDRSNATTAKTLKGSRKLHSVSSTGIGYQIKVRELSCYCQGCMNNADCTNKDYVSSWKQQVLKAVDKTDGDANNAQKAGTAEDHEFNQAEQNTLCDTVGQKSNSDQENVRQGTGSADEAAVRCNREIDEIKVNDFVAVLFETKKSQVCFFAKVVSIENNDVQLEYLEKTGQYYQYPARPDISWQTKADIVCKLEQPDMILTGFRVKCMFKLSKEQEVSLKKYKLK